MSRLLGGILLLGIGLFSSALEAAPVVAVFELRDSSGLLSPSDRAQLTRYLSAQVASGGQLLVVPEADLARALREEKAESYRECYDEACQIEIGRELAANKSLLAEVVRLGSSCALVATLYDLEKATTEQATTEKGACSVDGLSLLIERAAAKLKGTGPPPPPPPASGPTAPRAGVAISASHLRFYTKARGLTFGVQIAAPDGRGHGCPGPVTLATPCDLDALAIGEAQLLVTEEKLVPYDYTFDVEPKNHTKTFLLFERPSNASVIAWSFGGMAAAAGVALFSVGVGTDTSGMVYAGIPATLVGLGVLVLGFFFDGMVAVDESTLDLP